MPTPFGAVDMKDYRNVNVLAEHERAWSREPIVDGEDVERGCSVLPSDRISPIQVGRVQLAQEKPP